MFQKKWLKHYALLYLAVALLGVAMLIAAGLLPQERVYANLQASKEQFQDEGETPYLFDGWSDVYRLDAFSESLILNHSYYMDVRTSPESIFFNPCYRDGWHPVSSLIKLAEDPTIQATSNRSHYWLGFRAIVRPLLCLMDYPAIRAILSTAFFALLFAGVLALQRQAGTAVSVCFALTAISMNPVIVSTSLQFSCCFLIAFAGVIAVCLTHRKPRALYAVFLLLGQLTQYFDFYTSPLITWGLPFIALIAIRRAQGRGPRLGEGLRLLAATLLMWGGAYAGMWLLKMILTTCFTSDNGFAVLTNQLLYYTGIAEASEGQTVFTAWGALWVCLQNVFTASNLWMLGAAIIALAAYAAVMHRRGGLRMAGSGVWIYAVVGVLPAIWLMFARQASGRHSYFQYRTLAVLVFAVFCFGAQLFEPRTTAVKD